MALTKATYSMITGAPYNIFDFMTPTQIAAVVNDDYTVVTNNEIYAAILAAESAVPSGGKLYWPTGTFRIGSNEWELAPKIIRHFSDAPHLAQHPSIHGTGGMTITTEAVFGSGASRGTELSGLSVFNTNTNGACIRIRNGGIKLTNIIAESTGTNSDGILLEQSFLQSWSQVFCRGNTGMRLFSNNTAGAEAIIANTFTQVSAFGSGDDSVGFFMHASDSNLIQGNVFINPDVEQANHGIKIEQGKSNTFINAHIETSDTGIHEYGDVGSTWVMPVTGNIPSSLWITSEHIPSNLTGGGVVGPRQFAGDFYSTFFPASTACGEAISTVSNYRLVKIGKVVTITVEAVSGIAGNNFTNFRYGETISPSELYPVDDVWTPIIITDAGTNYTGALNVSSAGVISVYRNINATSFFTNGATVGLPQDATISYVTNV